MRVLNLYAGIGGNRKLWKNVEVTAIEINGKIARIYRHLFPDDEVIVTDAHQFLLDNFENYDFIWSSPPCPSHSRFNFLHQVKEGVKLKYPDMKLYEEIIFLKHFFKGKWVVENVFSYYEPLIIPQESDNHYFWCNFLIGKMEKTKRDIRNLKEKMWEFDMSEWNISNGMKKTLLNNVVNPKLGLHILNCARNEMQSQLKKFVKRGEV